MLHLHPVMVIGILAISEHFFGVWGLLLGVPVIVYLIRCVIMGEDILAEGALSPRRKKT
jgi:predicted PurR-regulated permease PerM